jgi:hypothetical protein
MFCYTFSRKKVYAGAQISHCEAARPGQSPELWEIASGNGILPVILIDRRDAYPTKTARNDSLWPLLTEELRKKELLRYF